MVTTGRKRAVRGAMRAAGRRRTAKLFAAALLGCPAVGCTAIPGDGPAAINVAHEAHHDQFELFTIDPEVVAASRRNIAPALASGLGGKRRLFVPVLETGDLIRVAVWESADAGLFSNTQNRQAVFDQVLIDNQGMVFLPFAGRLQVAGKTVEQARSLIQSRLERETLRPQVELRLLSNRRNQVTVAGAVPKPGIYPLDFADGSGSLVRMLATAGGAGVPAHRAAVTVVRGSARGSINLELLYNNNGYDIALYPGDQIVVADAPSKVSVLGAVEKKGSYDFTKFDFRLIDALALAGGLNDNRADRTGVFLFRLEDPKVVNTLRSRQGLPPLAAERIATVYRLNLHDARALFFAQEFQMLGDDVVFVTNAPLAEWDKLARSISQSVFLARTGVAIAN